MHGIGETEIASRLAYSATERSATLPLSGDFSFVPTNHRVVGDFLVLPVGPITTGHCRNADARMSAVLHALFEFAATNEAWGRAAIAAT